MNKHFPIMYESPDKPVIISGLFYCILSFFSLPFLMTLLQFASERSLETQCGYELAFHIINFLVVLGLFRHYLADSFLQVQLNLRKVLCTAGVSLLVIAVWILVSFVLYFLFFSTLGYITLFYALPITELDVFAFTTDLVQGMPLWGTLCTVLLTPITTACLFYSTGFAPAANRKPWLAYLVVALVLLFPRACNAFNFDSLPIELPLYLAQLPIHWAACWAYQKTDTIWAPVFTLSCANLLYCLAVTVLF